MKRFELIKACAIGMAEKCKKEMSSIGKQWDFGNGFQTENTVPKNWEKLYRTYPVKSRTGMFDLTSVYSVLMQEGFINA